jgi:hypothetical protein
MRVARKKKQPKETLDVTEKLFSPTDRGNSTGIDHDKLQDALGDSTATEVVRMLSKAIGAKGQKGCSTAEQLRIFKKYTPKAIALIYALTEAQDGLLKETARVFDEAQENSGKRWHKDEDEYLIELATMPGSTMMNMAATLGRTPGAIQSRLSQLVGIGKISQEIAGRFIGTLNGEHVVGVIDGELTKQ